MARLVVTGVDGRPQDYPIGALTTLGRQPDQHVQILDRVVSKEHALITFSDHGYFLQDQGSRNGTFVNGDRVAGRTRLNDGDEITLGSTRIVFHDLTAESLALRARRQVTINATFTETAIRSRLAYDDHEANFLPEAQLSSVEALRADYEKLRISFELNQAIGTQRDIDRVLETVLVKAFEFTRADRGVILLFNDQGGLEPRCYQNRHGDDETVELSETIISEVMQKRNAVLSSDAMVDSRFGGAHSIIMQGIRSTMCVPLMVAQEILGMIHLDTKIATGVFQEKDLQVLTVFAQQAAVRIANVRLAKRAEDEAVVRTNLSRLLSPNLVDEVVRGNVAVEKGGVLRRASVLFIDIRGFTGMSERLAPQDMVTMLNEYFEIMVEIVFKYEGTLDKFIGDEIMAVWGAPVEQEDDAERAVRAALDMIRELNRFNTFRLANGEQAIRVGCGINCGDIVAGYMGSSRTLSYTVIGDVVNTAARLCSHAQAGQILISDAVATRLGNRFQLEPLPDATLKGKSRPVKVLQVHAER